MKNKKDAKNAVMGIAKEYGFIEKDIMDRMEPDVRLAVEESMRAKDKKAAHAIKTLAKHIYASDARFVFELLQNADDNRFTHANTQGESPFISFEVYPDRIVVECNEDGFTARDLSAICTVGESTKSASHGYIGAKGIGFKSVFIAAWKVHIQSGNFSFFFQHKKGDLGLGMVLPVWEDTFDVLPDALTRMTLYLHEEGDPQEIKFLHDTVFKQLNDLQQTSLLFLRKLKEIRVFFYNNDGSLQNSKEFRVGGAHNSRYSLKTEVTDEDGQTTVERKHYHVTRQIATDLPKSNNRDLPDTEEATQAYSRAEVVLAFPLTKLNKPLLEQQEIFAFLPIRESSFKFLIHSDFDTSANRQDISNSRRNRKLLGWVAKTFLKAVLEFCEHPDLCYSWPEFLPPAKDDTSKFWSTMCDEIKTLIRETPILKPRHGNNLRKINDVVILVKDFVGDEDNPLLDDSTLDPFLSSRYSPVCTDLLKDFGLERMCTNLLVNMLRADLESETSRMKSDNTSAEWHSKLAKLLMLPKKEVVRNLALLPLRGGEWVSASNMWTIYFPTTRGISVPPELNIKVLEPSAVANEDRRILFAHLGIIEPSIAYVRASIFSIYSSVPCRVSRDDSKAHLCYLYLTQPTDETEAKFEGIAIHSEDGHVGYPHREVFYLRTGHPYGPEALLLPTDSAPGFQIHLLHPTYLENPPLAPTLQHPPWREWLRKFLLMHERLSFFSREASTMSEACKYVAEHRPEKFLGLLKYLWKYEGNKISENDDLMESIKDTDASNFCMADIPATDLDQTFLPLPSLQRICERFMEEYELFPFLKIDEIAASEELSSPWIFLHTAFSVGKDDDSDFLLEILWRIHDSDSNDPDRFPLSIPQRILDLYVSLDSKCLGAADRKAERSHIRNFIEMNGLLFVPHLGEPEVYAPEWFDLGSCRWDGPPNMRSRRCLKSSYSQLVDEDQLGHLSRFMQRTLSIPSVSWKDLVTELEALRDEGCEDLDHLITVYEWINKLTVFGEDLRNAFQHKELIFVVTNGKAGWYRSSDCLWSSTTEIRGKVTLNEHYEDLEKFFIETLGVKTLTLQMVYDELLQTGPQASPSDVKAKIGSLSALLQTESSDIDPNALKQAYVFPITNPDGTKSLVTASAEFAIGDRDYLIKKFQHRIKLLDYSLKDIRYLRNFFEWAELGHRYLSVAIREFTSVCGETEPLIPRRDRDLKRVAYGLLRVAATFNSPRYQTDPSRLYEMLRTANIEMTDGITSVLSISQDGNVTEVKEPIGSLHISEQQARVTVYVPVDKKKQELCFSSLLPKQFTEWLMRDPVTHIQDKVDGALLAAVTAVLSSDPSVVDLVLDHHGVIDIEVPNEDPINDDDDSDESVQRPVTPDILTSGSSAEYPYTPSRLSSDIYYGSPYPSISATNSTSRARIQPSEVSSEEDMNYRRLLRQVIGAARRDSFPSIGAYDMSRLGGALPAEDSGVQFAGFDGVDVRNAFWSDSQRRRDEKIGAAGELYAFELLSALRPGLRGWGRQNWQSTIRKYVKVHPDYEDMTPWTGRETADLVYNDTEGDLTALLVGNGYLDSSGWHNARPKYYIEVKTTTGPLRAPFFMSKYQFMRMQATHNNEDHSEVYMVLRVFGIQNETIGMSIYMDPEQLRVNGDLVFTGQTWSVVPRQGSQS